MMTGEEYKASLFDGRCHVLRGEAGGRHPGHPFLGPPAQRVADDYDWLKTQEIDGHSPINGVPTIARGAARQGRPRARGRDDGPRHLHVDHDPGHGAGEDRTTPRRSTSSASTATSRTPRRRTSASPSASPTPRVTARRPPGSQDDPDAYVHVVDRSPDGVVIRGAKLHITAASLGHDLMMMPTKSMKAGEEDYAIAAMVPVNAPGVKIINTTYAPRHEDTPRLPGVGHGPTRPRASSSSTTCSCPTSASSSTARSSSAALFAHSLGLWERLGGLAGMADGGRRAGRAWPS